MSARKPVYLDFNAGAPLHPRVTEALLRFFSDPSAPFPQFHNPSSIHGHGRMAKQLLAEARARVARSLGEGVSPEQVLFTSSGTEANQQAIRSALEGRAQPHWITTPVEHHSVRVLEDWVRERGGRVSYLPIDGQGRVRLDEADAVLAQGGDLLSFVWVNNETGVIQPADRLIEMARRRDIPVHVDAAQAWGKITLDLAALGADWAAFSCQKIGAPAGTGVLFSRNPAKTRPLIAGSQEHGRRGGTENLLGIMLSGVAAESLDVAAQERVRELRDRLEAEILRRIAGATVNGADAPRVANTTNISFSDVESAALVMALDLDGYSVSSGSACASGSLKPSHVLLAMGRTRAEALASIRVSFGAGTSWETLEGFIQALGSAVARARTGAAAANPREKLA